MIVRKKFTFFSKNIYTRLQGRELAKNNELLKKKKSRIHNLILLEPSRGRPDRSPSRRLISATGSDAEHGCRRCSTAVGHCKRPAGSGHRRTTVEGKWSSWCDGRRLLLIGASRKVEGRR